MRQVFTCPGQCVSRTLMIVTFALALLLAPLAVLAAPYADYVIDVRTGEVLQQTDDGAGLHLRVAISTSERARLAHRLGRPI